MIGAIAKKLLSRLLRFRPRWHHRILWLGILVGLGLGLVGPLSVGGQGVNPTENLDVLKENRQRLEIQQQQISVQQQQLEQTQNTANGYLKVLGDRIEILNLQIGDYQKRLAEASAHLRTLEQKLEKSRREYEPKVEATIARLRFLQRQPLKKGSLDLLLRSNTVDEFLARRQRLIFAYQADSLRLETLHQEFLALQEQTQRIAIQKNQISLIHQQLLNQRDDLSQQSQVQADLIRRLNSDRIALAAAKEQLAEDSKNLTLLIRQKTLAQTENFQGALKFGIPHLGRISSHYGWRQHPISQRKIFHGGMDFAGDYGSTIYAAAAGKVIFSGWYGSYGNTLIINHGNQLVTLYGHNSRLLVREGKTVNRGEAIALVGSTGLSTGPHLHFEVRENGAPVDPRKYL